MLSSPVYAKLQPRHAPSVPSALSLSSALDPVLSAAFNDLTDQHPNALSASRTLLRDDIQTPPKSCLNRALLHRQHRAPLSPLPATHTSHPVSVANKRLTETITPLDATLTKNRGKGAPYLSLRSTKSQPPLCFHPLTNCPFSIPFVLPARRGGTFIHAMGGSVPPPPPRSRRSNVPTFRRGDALCGPQQLCDTLCRWEFCGGSHAGWEHRTT